MRNESARILRCFDKWAQTAELSLSHIMFNLVRGIFSFVYLALNTLFWCALLYILTFLQLLMPFKKLRELFSTLMVGVAENWIACNNFVLNTLYGIRWDIHGLNGLHRDRSYLVIANHQSWVDIVVLQKIFNRRIPFARFFIKQELVYVPLLGLAWKSLDFPRMKRYSKEYLEKHPEKRGEDLATTRRMCAKLRGKHITVLNFLEGTRFTRAKHDKQNSPYKHLLKPKTGGLAFVIESMGDQFHSMLDVTLYYPRGPVTLWGLLKGQMPEVRAEIREIPIPAEFIGKTYLEDPVHREQIQAWVHDIWETKDQILAKSKS